MFSILGVPFDKKSYYSGPIVAIKITYQAGLLYCFFGEIFMPLKVVS
jgi:hypothetical protein